MGDMSIFTLLHEMKNQLYEKIFSKFIRYPQIPLYRN